MLRETAVALRPRTLESEQEVVEGDSLEVMSKLQDAFFTSIITDPPYGLSQEPDIAEVIRHWLAGDVYKHNSRGFMGKSWDSFVPGPEYWRECYRVLKPGGHLLAFSSTRTDDLLSIAIRFAGFERRDEIRCEGVGSLAWMYGSGFPKSLNVALSIDKVARGAPQGGADSNKRGGHVLPARTTLAMGGGTGKAVTGLTDDYHDYVPATEDAKRWEGWGTALKPAWEIILVFRKPLIGTVVENVLKHGTGGLNIDACRVGYESDADWAAAAAKNPGRDDLATSTVYAAGRPQQTLTPEGRWPANVVLVHNEECELVGERQSVSNARANKGVGLGYHGGNCERGAWGDVNAGAEMSEVWRCAPGCPVAALDAQSGVQKDGKYVGKGRDADEKMGGYEVGDPDVDGGWKKDTRDLTYGGVGGASRFFYTPKASRSEREAGCEHLSPRTGAQAVEREDESAGLNNPRAGAGRTAKQVRNHQPTVKPIALMRWLLRLVTPPGGVVLDPFGGSGTTACAAAFEDVDCLVIEREPDYAAIARARVEYWRGIAARGLDERTHRKK